MSPPADRLEVAARPAQGFYRVILHYGFMDEVDVPADLAADRILRRAAST